MNTLGSNVAIGAHLGKEALLAFRRARHSSTDQMVMGSERPAYLDMLSRIDRGMVGLIGIGLSAFALAGSVAAIFLNSPETANFLTTFAMVNIVPSVTDTMVAARTGDLMLSVENFQ